MLGKIQGFNFSRAILSCFIAWAGIEFLEFAGNSFLATLAWWISFHSLVSYAILSNVLSLCALLGVLGASAHYYFVQEDAGLVPGLALGLLCATLVEMMQIFGIVLQNVARQFSGHPTILLSVDLFAWAVLVTAFSALGIFYQKFGRLLTT